ncbi:hypothetical protein [Tessaracoccus sp. OH4464_COT-324]|uniref:hypothetical protein n=1 Tax=Tessaracoccus sp. OH4464_COT-324 TaxID=2491059 RepID=UPI00131A2C7D|nr:hypothetical protein [Tessaracoccus sp. OH4464_COT-324]
MAETRTYDPSEGDDLAKLVRDALGENVRPVEPGSFVEWSSEPSDDGTASLVDVPQFDF